jgi:two-component sensor histidine kinase
VQVRDALWSFEPLLTTPAGARENAILVLHELVSNIVEHAGTVGEGARALRR